MTDGLLERADRLYGLPHAEFTPARDALATELRAADRDLAARVKALRKPSVAAWVVNLLVRREAEQVEQVLQVGAALREAQAALDGEELRALTRQRRQLTAAVTTRARALAGEEGVRVTDAVAEQVEATLTAAMVDAGAAAAVRSGLLVAALSATGVESVDVAAGVAVPEALGFVASPGPAAPQGAPGLHVVPAPAPDPAAERAARREAERRLKDASARLGRAEKAHRAAESGVRTLQAQALQVQAEIDELRRRIAEHEVRAEGIEEELAEAEETLESAAAALTDAVSRRDEARAALDGTSEGTGSGS